MKADIIKLVIRWLDTNSDKRQLTHLEVELFKKAESSGLKIIYRSIDINRDTILSIYPSIYPCNFQLTPIHWSLLGSKLNQGKGLRNSATSWRRMRISSYNAQSCLPNTKSTLGNAGQKLWLMSYCLVTEAKEAFT